MISKHMSISSINSNLIPVRMLTQFAYCKRLAYMEWVQEEFESNKEVIDGKYQHRFCQVMGIERSEHPTS